MIISNIKIKNDNQTIDVNFSCKRAARNLSVKNISSVRAWRQGTIASRAYQSSGNCGTGFFGISVTNWCNTARSGPNIVFT